MDMNKKKVLYYILFYIFLIKINLFSYDPVFLRISPFARTIGMAEAFTSMSYGTYGLYYNPAGMSSILSHEIQCSYSMWMEKINYGYIGLVFTEPLLGKIKLGGSYSQFEIENDGENGWTPIDWSIYDSSVDKIANKNFSLGLSCEFFDIVSIGLSYKYNLSNVGKELFKNSTLDIGLIANFLMSEQMIRLGFLASGTGNKLLTKDVEFYIPQNYLIGISDEIFLSWAKFIISTDITFTPDLIALYKIGFELIVFNNIFLRAGNKIGAFNHMTYGAGFKLGPVEVNYAFEEYENYKPSHTISLLLNFGTPNIDLKIEPLTFSPNNDGIMDKIIIMPQIREIARVVSAQIKIYDDKENLLLTIPLKNKHIKLIEWDGRIGNKKMADGEYLISIAGEYEKSGWTESQKIKIKIDTTPPEAKIKAEPYKTMPNKKKALLLPATFHFAVNDLSGVDKWEFNIWSKDKKRFFTTSWKGNVPEIFKWDGKDNNGDKFETNKEYFYSLTIYDIHGNKTETKPEKVLILTREVKVIYSSYAVFDKNKSSVRMSAYKKLKKIRETLLKYPDADIIIAGHTDSKEDPGNYGTLEELSIARAKALKFFLRDILGFKKRYIIVQGFGDTQPIADNETEKGRTKNRRVEVMIRSTVYR